MSKEMMLISDALEFHKSDLENCIKILTEKYKELKSDDLEARDMNVGLGVGLNLAQQVIQSYIDLRQEEGF